MTKPIFDSNEKKMIERLSRLDHVKKNPYIFLVMIFFPFMLYVFPSEYTEFISLTKKDVVFLLILVVLINYQIDIYLINKKINLIVDILKNNDS